jgi:hypothetical protein
VSGVERWIGERRERIADPRPPDLGEVEIPRGVAVAEHRWEPELLPVVRDAVDDQYLNQVWNNPIVAHLGECVCRGRVCAGVSSQQSVGQFLESCCRGV